MGKKIPVHSESFTLDIAKMEKKYKKLHGYGVLLDQIVLWNTHVSNADKEKIAKTVNFINEFPQCYIINNCLVYSHFNCSTKPGVFGGVGPLHLKKIITVFHFIKKN